MTRTSSIRKVQHAENCSAHAPFGPGCREWISRTRALGSVLALVVLLVPHLMSAQAQPDEYQVKAAFVYHFARLVEWPTEVLPADNRPLVICFAGDDAYFVALASMVQGKQINGHQLLLRRVKEKDDMRSCHLLFVPGKEQTRSASFLALLKDAPVLTVGDSENFAQQGGIIGLCLQENRVRFEVNLDSAQRAGIRISSRLLLLAKSVIGGRGQR